MTIQEAIDSGYVTPKKLIRSVYCIPGEWEDKSIHIPCEKCKHTLYWKRSKEPKDAIETTYIYEVVCELKHSPADKCSDYKRRWFKWMI